MKHWGDNFYDWLLLWHVNKCFSNVRGRGHWNVHLSINFWELVAIQSANSHKLSSWFNGLSICATTHKKINKHEYLILNLGWHLLQQPQTSSNLQFEPYKTGNENAKNHEFFRAQNILSFFVLCIQPIYLFIYSVPDSEHPILCHVYSKRFLRHDLCQISKKDREKVQALEPTAPIKRNRTK